MAKIKRDPKKVALDQAILDAYQPKSAEEMNDALKDLFGPMFEAMLKGELNHHLGYESNDKSQKKDDNRRNGYGKKQIKTTQGDIAINVPRDRDGSFEPQLVPKRKKMFLQSKIRFWLCMRAACRKEIYPRRSRISMASACHMR